MADSKITPQMAGANRQSEISLRVDHLQMPNSGVVPSGETDLKGEMTQLVKQVKTDISSALKPVLAVGKRVVASERAFADVKKSVHFSNDQEANQYQSDMMRLAGDLGLKQESVAQIVSDAAQSGIEKNQLLSFAQSAAKVAVVWNVSAKDATATLAHWRASMQLSQQQAMGLANATNALSHSMGVKAKSVAAVVTKQGEAGTKAGLNVQETAALSASLLTSGSTEAQASEAISNILGSLTAGKAKNTQQKAAMTTLGIEPAALAQRMEADARGTLLDVFDRLKNISPDQREDVVTDLFGEKSTAAILKLVGSLERGNKSLNAAFKQVDNKSNYSNSIDTDYDIFAKTSAHQLAQLRVRFDQISVALGQRLLPIVNNMLPPLLSVVDSMNKFAEANPKLATGLLVATAAVIPLLKAGSAIVKFSQLMKGGGQDRLKVDQKNIFAAGLNKTRRAAKRATLQLARLNRELNRLGSQSLNDSGGSDSGGSDGDESRRKRKKQPRKRPRKRPRIRNAGGLRRQTARFARWIARTPQIVGSMFSGSKLKSGLSGAMSKVGSVFKGVGGAVFKGAGKLFKPLDIALNGVKLVSALAKGNKKKIAGTAGDMLGGMGGAATGAMAGAAIGSVVPILGTAVGGLVGSVVGGLGGSSVGRWLGESFNSLLGQDNDKKSPSKQQSGMSLRSISALAMGGGALLPLGISFGEVLGDKIMDWFGEDKTDKAAPATVAEQSKQLEKSSQQQINFAPVIHVTPSGNPAYDQGFSTQLLEQMKAELSPILLGNNDVATRADASLLDRSNT
ncbi:phage tail tape measure protein [Vibrio gazogenes]|uniref:Phage tail tape measure protein n=1 Tax=Vibrio gazogenes TaxID=687 RepID=A0A1Z2SBW3_VIBGA|nr:phage tail tape measure protein [Vibrio gazogenes]ASA54664.1 phage tail tape measure protein [Vibrio gazogenes]